jgi:cyclopropane-fatty-acyl-phospholipid synthase
MLLHTILAHTPKYFRDNGIAVTISDLKFMRFIGKEIFPGGELPAVEDLLDLSEAIDFSVERIQLLGSHYARTLDMWAANL